MLCFSTLSPLYLSLLLFLSYHSPVLSYVQTGMGTLKVTIVRAWGLQGDVAAYRPTDAYVKMWYGTFKRRTPVIESDNPRWNIDYDVGEVTLKTECEIYNDDQGDQLFLQGLKGTAQVDTRFRLEFEVWDEDWRYDDLLIRCATYPKQGSYTFTCTRGSQIFEAEYTLTCDRHLTGERCDRYDPFR